MRKLQVEVDRFGSGEELPAQCGTEKYDIVFTDYQNLVFESFQYHPVWFVRKSNLDNDLGNAIGEIERQMDYKGKMVTVSFRDKEHDYRTATFKLANLLDNAIEAEQKEQGKRMLSIFMYSNVNEMMRKQLEPW